MKVAIEGCCHGELDQIYATLQQLEAKENMKVDLLLICGDFQAVRNGNDLESMAVPVKYRQMQTFHKYYSGEAVAPVLTIFIGGNHESASHLWELPYGGWAAPNIYYMGYASVLTYGGLRLGGLSGIFKQQDYMKGHFERPPFDHGSMRSFYHVREVDIFRMKLLQQPMDVFLSHDWPNGIAHHGDLQRLLSAKPYFREDINANALGSAPAMELLHVMRPLYWFSAHLHVKFSAVVRHDKSTGQDNQSAVTKFLALDKCLPRRDFLQVIDFPEAQGEKKLRYDAEWLCVLRKTASLNSCSPRYQCMPSKELWRYQPLPHELSSLRDSIDLTVPENFCQTAPVHQPGQRHPPPATAVNPQSQLFCSKLGIDNIQDVCGAGVAPTVEHGAGGRGSRAAVAATNDDEIDLEDDDDDDEESETGAADSGTTAVASSAASGVTSGAVNHDEITLDDDDYDGDDATSPLGLSPHTASESGCAVAIGPRPRPPQATSEEANDGEGAECVPGSLNSVTPSMSTAAQGSTVDERKVDRCPPGASTLQRSAMFLPAPSLSASSAAADVSSTVSDGLSASSHGQLASGETHMDIPENSEPARVEDIQGLQPASTAIPVPAAGAPRVLKRRNFALYASVGDEDDDDDDSEVENRYKIPKDA